MEKKSNLLGPKYQDLLWRMSNLTYQAFVRRIVGAVRRAAQDVPAFRDSYNGCIRITIVPLSCYADEWLGGMSSYSTWLEGEENDACRRGFVFKIDPRGSYIIQYVCEDGHTEPVNCCGYSALKTAWALEKHRHVKAGSSAEPYAGYFIEENGWSTHEGTVCTTIILDDKEFADLCICTSGAKPSEDKECSLAGILEAQECFEHYKGIARFVPYIDGKKSPLEQVWCEVSHGTNAGWHGQIEP